MNFSRRSSRRASLSCAMLLALGVVIGLSGCSSSSPASPLSAATVNGHAISIDDYGQVLAFAEAASNTGGPYNWQAETGRNNAATVQSQVLGFLVNLELMRQALSDHHATVSPKEMQVAEKQFDDNLKAGETSSDPTTKASAEAQRPFVTGRVRELLSEQTAYEAKLISVLNLWTVQLNDIIVSSKTQADQLLTQLQGGADFAKLATQTNPNATDGGNYGTAWYGELPNAFSTALFGAKPDKDTPPQYSVVAYNGQYVVLKVTDKKQQRLSTVTDTNSQTSIFSQWLQNVYYSKMKHQEFVYIPPAATQQAAQG
jgi:PPIC-type peptidyl-prolyl cis-trans isomerase-like protein/SurA-like protein